MSVMQVSISNILRRLAQRTVSKDARPEGKSRCAYFCVPRNSAILLGIGRNIIEEDA
jgi:hypothetical protein